jgi:hypothetical protein
MKRKGQFQSVLILGCLCFCVSGCQWALSIEPGDMTVEPGKPIDIRIVADETYWVQGPNGITVRPFDAPSPIRVRFSSGEVWTRPLVEKINAHQYVYTFRGTVAGPTAYTVDPNAPITHTVGKGAGPYEISIASNPNVPTPAEEGLQLGREHREGKLPTYRLLIELRNEHWSTPDREAFIKGVMTAYEETGAVPEGRRYIDALRDAILGSTFSQAREEGIRHAAGQVSDSYIQILIGNVGGSGATALAWKAGYIDGFATELRREHSDIEPEDAFQQAEAMYNALKRAMGL